jgi:hypothetical protein
VKKLLNISCAKATLLLSKKEDGRLSLLEKWQLRLHMGICSMCRLFQKQSSFISSNAKSAHVHSDACLTAEQKQKMEQLLK